jgi:hypothetical protein
VDGALRAARGGAPGRGGTALQGRVSLRIAADVPPLIALTPGLDAIVVGILEAILGRLEGALRRGLLDDYELWVREQQRAAAAAGAAAQQPAAAQQAAQAQQGLPRAPP